MVLFAAIALALVLPQSGLGQSGQLSGADGTELSLVDAPAVPLSAKVDITTPTGVLATGYTRDSGQAYNDTLGFGWVRQDSLAGAHVPHGTPQTGTATNAGNTRNRDTCSAVAQHQRSFIHMQAPAAGANDPTPIAWEYALANGRYQVTVGVGDPSIGSDPEAHTIHVEGVTAFDGYGKQTGSGCTTTGIRTTTVWADVTDGKLTVDALGGTNTKLSFVTIDSVPLTGLTATPGTSSVDLDWTDTPGATSYQVRRSTTLPVLPTAAALGTVTTSAFTDTAVVAGQVYYYSVTPVGSPGGAGGDVVRAQIDAPTATQPTLPVKIDFTTTAGAAAVPATWTPDTGANYNNSRGFGWVDAGTQVPLDLTASARVRTGNDVANITDATLTSFNHMQYNNVSGASTGNPRAGSWQIAVPNGSYDVTVTAGEPTPGSDLTSHRINVEGTQAVSLPISSTTPPTGAARFKSGDARVTVSDGFLTVDPIGGTNTKIASLTITPTPSDLPPAAPTGLVATAGNHAVTLDWTDNTEADLDGYRVYRGTGATVDTTGTPVSGTTLVEASTFIDTTAENDTSYRYVVVAVDAAGNASPASTSVTAQPDAASATEIPLPFGIAFGTQTSEVPGGYLKDYGQPFTNTRGRGFVDPSTHAPLSLVGNGRFRDARGTETIAQRGLMHLRANEITGSFANLKIPGDYEVAVPNGTYDVTMSAGDQPGASTAACPAPCYDSVHTLTAEGVAVIDGFQATAAQEFEQRTKRITVLDGKLTIGAAGGTNTKINHLRVVAVDTTAPAAPGALSATPADSSVSLAWTASADTDVVGYRVYRSTSSPVALTAGNRLTPDPLAALAFNDGGAVNGTEYFYAVTAIDGEGNESPASDEDSATPADTTAPSAPVGLTVGAGDEEATLSWTPSEALDLDHYNVYQSTSANVLVDEDNLVGEVTEATFLAPDLTNGTAYYFVVTAVDDAGNESTPSNEGSAVPTEAPDTEFPAAPAGVTATKGDGKVTIEWTANTESDLAGYRILRAAVSGGPYTEVGRVLAAATSYVDNDLVNGQPYYYVVTAADLANNVSVPSAQVSATPTDTTAPAVPAGLTAAAGIQRVTLTWTANTEPDLRGYRIYRFPSATPLIDDAHEIGSLIKPGRTFVDSDLEPGVRQHYAVVAYDLLGNTSEATAVVDAVPTAAPDTTAPAAPAGLTATLVESRVDLAWDAVAAGDLIGYNVYRSATAGGTRVKLNSAPLTGRTFSDSSAPAGATAHYVVTAVDTSANESGESNRVTADLPANALTLKYTFTTAAAPDVPGYTKDTGAAYTAARGYGWVAQSSLSSTAHTPLDLTANTRLRTRAAATDLQNRTIHMQYGDIVPTPTANGNLTAGAWEYALPNGRYTVEASVGDQPGGAKTGCAAPCYDSQHTVRAEGVPMVSSFQPTAAVEYRTGTTTVDVTDGRLTVDAIGGTNTKLNWVTITSAGPLAPDTTAPGAPTSLTALAGDTVATLSWAAPGDPDVAGYHVYRGTGATVEAVTANRVSASLVGSPSFTDQGLTNGTQYRYVVTAVDNSGNESAASVSTATTPLAGAGGAVDVKVNFADAATVPPSGYLTDFGQAFGTRTGTNQGTGLSYGWVRMGTSEPVSLEGNGRNRNTQATDPTSQPDLRLATFIHAQLPASVTTGVHVDGSWEMAVPNGIYTVTVGLGDPGVPVDSSHWINIENQNGVAAFVPTATASGRFAVATRTVAVTDGRLTLSPAGGTNTKVDYVDITSVDRAGRPYTLAVTPANLATNIVGNTTVATDNVLNADVGAVDGTTLGNGNVTLTRVSDGVAVPGTGATSGGGDTISFLPSAPLQGGVLYRFTVTSGAKDKSGRPFLPFSSVFTTASGGGTGGGSGDLSGVAFDRTDSGAALGGMYTSLVIGPDGKLYAGSITGQIYRWTIAADGSLTARETINTVRTHATAKGWEGAPNRTIIGLAFDPASTAANPILWITDNYAYLGSDVPDFTGAVSRLSGPNLENYQEVVVNLPRSIKDHETNSIAFKDGKLLITQGSMNAMGANDGTWRRDERLLSAAMLQLDPAKLPATLPLDAGTPEMNIPARGGVPAHQGTYDPYAPNAPLTLYATGIRNAFDLVAHSNGRVYTGTNGSAAGGNTPATPATLPAACATRPDGPYTAPTAPAITNNRQAETDYLFDVHQGKYYGHPNPLRCEYVLNAGNPNGYTGNPLFKVTQYPLGQQADPNYDLEHVHDAGLHASANGTIEYKNTVAFGGALAGKLVLVRYSANQEIVVFDVGAEGGVSAAVTGITGFTGFKQPLDVAQDATTGNLYVTELTDNPATTGIKLLKPQGGGSAPKVEATPRVVFTEVQGGAASAAKSVSVKNVGGLPLTISAASITGADAALFARSGGPTLPATVQPGATVTFPVTFNPTVAGPRGATLRLTTNDSTTPTTSVTLRGLGTLGLGGANEPSLQWVLDTLQIPVDVGDPDPTNNDMPAGSALIGDEVAMPSFTKAAFDRVVGITPLSLFGPAGPTGNPNTAVIAAHSTSDPSVRTVLLNAPNGSNQQVLPEWTQVGEYDLDASFGFDVTFPGLSNRVAYSEDALNTWDPTNKRKIRVYPMKNPDGSVVANTFIVAPEDVLSPVDFQDAAFIVTNVKAPAVAGEGELRVTPGELVFSGVRGSTSAAQPLVVTNNGTTPLQISEISVTGTNSASFSTTAAPQTVPVGGTLSIPVRFNPALSSPLGYQNAVLRIVSDDATTPTKDVGIYGLATSGEQGNNEPPLKAVVDTLGHPVDVGGTGLILGTGANPIGDEVRAPLFTKAGNDPVTLTPVARYSPDELLPFGWYEPNSGDPVTHPVATIALDQEQTLNPAIVAGGASSFDPGAGTFGIYVDSVSFGRKSYTQDALNTNIPHAARIYPAKDRSGAVLPNTYLVTFEDAQNGDYQDYVFRMTGAKPAGGGASGTPVARIDFKTADGAVASGYTADTGAAYTAARGFGWVKPGTATPYDMSAQTRDRSSSVERKLQTVILVQPTAAQAPEGPGAWEYAVPNGTYTVTVGVGDSSFVDSVHTVRVEGATAINGFVPTTASPFSTATVTVPVTDGKLTVDATGGTNTKLTYLDIDAPATGADTTPPTVSVAVSGLRASASAYKNAATVTVTASDTGSGLAGSSYSLDGAAFRPYSTPVEVTTLGAHTIRARAQDLAGNIATTTTTSFSVVAADASQAKAVVENGDGVPFPDRLTMSRIQSPQLGTTCKETGCDPATGPFIPANSVHDTSSLVIRNTGSDGLNVTDLVLAGPFALVDPPTLPALVPAGASLTVGVRFTASTIGSDGGLWDGSLTVKSDDPTRPSIPVQLAGFWQSQSENGQEPTLSELTRLFGYTTAITSAGDTLNKQGAIHASGDEVLSPYWLRADTTAPVSVRQLAAYHTQGNTATIAWHSKPSTSTTNIVTHLGVDGQSILPRRNGSTTAPAAGTFTPTGAFGLKIDGEWSDPVRNDQAADVTNGCTAPCGHHLRAWAARDRSGAVIANTYLVAMDYSGINYDYNDNLFLVSNVRPETAANPAAPAPLPGAASLQLPFSSAVAGTLADAAGAGTGFTSTQRNRLDVAAGSSSYDPTKLHLTTTGSGTLAIDSTGATGAGSPANADNTLVNGLQVPFDGDGGTFTLSARSLGSPTQLDAGSEQLGVMLGADQDNFVKLAVINRGGVPGVELYGETGGTGATVGTAVILPSPATITSIDLALVGKTSTRTVKAAYRINGGTWTVLDTSFAVPAAAAGKVFGARTYGGLLATNKGGAPFTATFDSFGVSNGDLTAVAADREALYRLDVAGTGTYTDTAGRIWTPDTGRFAPATAPAEGAGQAPLEIAGTDDDVLYRTYRGNVGNVAQAERVLSYTLPSRGAGTVDLRLHFAERAAGNDAAGERLFDIGVEGVTVRKSFDIVAAAGGQNTATVLSVDDVVVTGGAVNLSFAASVDYPAIAAIEVLCQGPCPAADTTAPAAPTGLGGSVGLAGVSLDWSDVAAADLLGYHVYRSGSAGGTFTRLTDTPVSMSGYLDASPRSGTVYYQVRAVDSSENVSDPSATFVVAPATQQPIRINTGGPAQTVGTTTWSACSSLTACSGWVSGGNAYAESDTITGVPAGLNNTIFQSEWTGGQNSGSAVGTRAFGFNVPVANGSYAVRLHFAELNKNAANLRLFDVRLEGATVLSNFDVFTAAGGIDRAVVREFQASVTDGVVTIDFITRRENAKISAIEIIPAAPDTTPPGAVTGLGATGSTAGIALTWAASPASDLAGYQIYRSATPTGTFTKVNTALVTGTSFTDASAPEGASSYQVTAVDRAGNESARSATVTSTRPDSTPPGAVTGLAATGSSSGVALTWAASGAGDLGGYHVYRSASPTGTFTRVSTAPVTATDFVDTTAPAGVSHYRVTAVDRSGNESAPSATVSATRTDGTPPAQLTGVTATRTGTSVTVAWSGSAASDLAGYSVYRATSAGGSFTKVTTTLLTTTTFTDSGAPAGSAVSYRVTASDTTGNESTPSATVTVAAVDATAPAVVTGVAASGSATGVSVTWTASGAPDLAGYTVYRAGAASGPFVKVNAALVSGTSLNDTGAPIGATSFYQVTATDQSSNESARSATVSAVRPAAPQQPVRINAGGGAQTVGATTWTACSSTTACSGRVTGGNAYSENDTVTGVPTGMNNAIFQSEWTGGQASGSAVGSRAFGFAVPVSNGTYTVRLHFAELNKNAANLRLFDVRLEGATVLSNFDVFAAAGGIDRAVAREFRTTVTDGVVTIDFITRRENAKVSAIEIIPVADTTAPGTVTGVTATGATAGNTLAWAASTAGDLAGYHVYRSASAGGTYSRLTTALLTARTFVDTTAPVGSAAFYQVTAVDTAGNESARSATVSATRPGGARPTVRINAGGVAQSTGGTTWAGCASAGACGGFVTGGFSHTENDTITGIPTGMNNAIFQSEWTGGQSQGTPVGSRAFGFNVPVANGAYLVRLHFAELNKNAADLRLFDVRLEGTTVLSSFDVFAAAGGIDRAVAREFTTTVNDGAATIDFITRKENAKVSAIELIPVGQ
ncbi:malectin domain-containing carbohydrate-binding protein [Nocardioides sp.]|uniref:malectin domain-containing carbohydrate-binding protein n=1 Tax=Nocardioides sp. TaxID=35761 RepID=UPI001A25C4E1|nr:malectin domain-containing carbohydrate-binding protein [Nocardioides sp.]MBJ7357901.1 choice-of-anchor D domain-containing protein [Nocardioides sp.]